LALKRRQQLARHVAMIHPTRSDQPRQGDAKLVLLKKLARANSHAAVFKRSTLHVGFKHERMNTQVKLLVTTDVIKSKTRESIRLIVKSRRLITYLNIRTDRYTGAYF